MRYWLEYIPFVATATIVKALPRPAALTLGGWLGSLGRFVQPRRVRIAYDNLRQTYPDMSDKEISATINEMFIHLGKSFVDMLRLDQYQSENDLQRYFQVSNQKNVEKALELKRGCIILTGHVGFWEAGNIFMPKLGFPFGVVAKPMRNPLIGDYFNRVRTSTGSYIINSRKGARIILKALKKNHCVGLLLDQHIRGKGSVAVPFFGRPAHTTTIITQMATRYRIPIVPAFAYREDDDTYSCTFGPMFILDGDLSDENIMQNTTLLNEKTEEGICKKRNQWFWLHRRWRPCCEK